MTPVKIKDVFIFPFTETEDIIKLCSDNKKLYLSINAEIIINARGEIAEIINQNVGYADGAGAVKALKKKGFEDVIRIPGCELWLQLVEKYYKEKSFYLIGSTEQTINDTVEKLRRSYPNINLVGYRNGYIQSDKDRNKLIEDVSQKKPDFVFVATGFPMQEFLMNDLYHVHKAVYLNLGGSFDVYTGKVTRAPRLIQKNGFEWFYRFITHPSRYKRQIVYIKFLWLYLMNKL